MILVAGGLNFLVLFDFVARGRFFDLGWFMPQFLGLPLDVVGVIVGFGGMAFGLAWMIRIYRAYSEPGERTWRYRDF
jgi:hypothetical protein